MNAHTPQAPADAVKSSSLPSADIADQVRAEYAKFLEKRDAIRKSTGRLRRSVLQTLLN
jgi:hypothetical protein